MRRANIPIVLCVAMTVGSCSDNEAPNEDITPKGFGPQSDAIRIFNYVRCVH